MPGVTVLSSSSALRTPGPSSPVLSRGPSGSQDDMSVAEIKEKARAAVQQARGATAHSLIKVARERAMVGSNLEADGDLKGALGAFHRAAGLASLVYETAEFKAKNAALYKEFVEFQQNYGNDLIPRTHKLEAKLTELERSKPQMNGTNGSPNDSNDGPIRKPGGSIADRMRSLQDAGMSVATTKRFSRELPTSPTVPDSPRPNAITRSSSSQTISSPPPQSTHFSQVPSNVTGSSPHAFVAPSSFGPPSPTSSTASSPRLGHLNISEFSQAFPSIDELDETNQTQSSQMPTFPSMPSVPTTRPGSSVRAPLPSPSTISRFPSLPLDLDPGPRPASTPIPPTLNTLISRPASPSQGRSPMSPSIPPKPAGLGSPSKQTSSSRMSATSTGDRPDLPVTNTIFPGALHDYIEKSEIKVLLLDVRDRDEFEREHIKGDAVVCLEPSVLTRDGLTGEGLEDSLAVAPRHESTLFRNRDKFDLVVMYDAESEKFSPPMSSVVRVIFETAFRRMLKKPPVILVGGLKAWKAAFASDVVGRRQGQGQDNVSISASGHGYTNGTVVEALHAGGGRIGGIDDLSVRAERLKSPMGPMSPSLSGMDGSNGFRQPSQHEIWTPNQKHTGSSSGASANGYGTDSSSSSRSRYSMDQIPETPRSPPEVNGNGHSHSPDSSRNLVRKPALMRPPSTSSIPSFGGGRPMFDNHPNGQHSPQFMVGQGSYPSASSGSIQYPQFPRPSSSNFSPSSGSGIVSPPPQASINPSPLSRRRSDYIDQSEQAVSSFAARPAIDYPDLSAQHVLRPPPVAATPPLERQDNRPRIAPHGSSYLQSGPRPPIIQSEYPITYWPDLHIATCGLKNLGNTCYMNATIQCLSATIPFARFFTDGRWKSAVNMVNPLGTKGHLTQAFSSILHELWHEDAAYLSPSTFRRSIAGHAKQFAGSEQHDSQEFLNFLLDGLHEDLNRILQKPNNNTSAEREAELEVLPQQIASEQEWKIYRMRNDSIVVDFFQGQFRNRMECLTCRKTSTTYNAFMYLTLPIPSGRGVTKVSLQQCLDAFVQEEVMEKSDAWHCPNCKTLRKATKRLSLSRLPPVLLIHLKRFSFKGPFTDKLETVVDFPLKNLDLTNYMPPPMPPGTDKRQSPPVSPDDPRAQVPPYKYDLYSVTNHFGTLSSGHYTAFINSRGSWKYCDDSRVTSADAKEVVGRPAYVLFYKRSKT